MWQWYNKQIPSLSFIKRRNGRAQMAVQLLHLFHKQYANFPITTTCHIVCHWWSFCAFPISHNDTLENGRLWCWVMINGLRSIKIRNNSLKLFCRTNLIIGVQSDQTNCQQKRESIGYSGSNEVKRSQLGRLTVSLNNLHSKLQEEAVLIV